MAAPHRSSIRQTSHSSGTNANTKTGLLSVIVITIINVIVLYAGKAINIAVDFMHNQYKQLWLSHQS